MDKGYGLDIRNCNGYKVFQVFDKETNDCVDEAGCKAPKKRYRSGLEKFLDLYALKDVFERIVKKWNIKEEDIYNIPDEI